MTRAGRGTGQLLLITSLPTSSIFTAHRPNGGLAQHHGPLHRQRTDLPFLFGVGAFSSIGISIGALFELIRRITESGLAITLAIQIFAQAARIHCAGLSHVYPAGHDDDLQSPL
jgi:hypothetical protein